MTTSKFGAALKTRGLKDVWNNHWAWLTSSRWSPNCVYIAIHLPSLLSSSLLSSDTSSAPSSTNFALWYAGVVGAVDAESYQQFSSNVDKTVCGVAGAGSLWKDEGEFSAIINDESGGGPTRRRGSIELPMNQNGSASLWHGSSSSKGSSEFVGRFGGLSICQAWFIPRELYFGSPCVVHSQNGEGPEEMLKKTDAMSGFDFLPLVVAFPFRFFPPPMDTGMAFGLSARLCSTLGTLPMSLSDRSFAHSEVINVGELDGVVVEEVGVVGGSVKVEREVELEEEGGDRGYSL